MVKSISTEGESTPSSELDDEVQSCKLETKKPVNCSHQSRNKFLSNLI